MPKQFENEIMKQTEWKKKREGIWNGNSSTRFTIFLNVFILGLVALAHLYLLVPKSDTSFFYLMIWKFHLCFVGLDKSIILLVFFFFFGPVWPYWKSYFSFTGSIHRKTTHLRVWVCADFQYMYVHIRFQITPEPEIDWSEVEGSC